jgi:TolB-like protein
MAEAPLPRKLATIVALDIAGYSARTEADEARTTAEVAALRKVIEGIAARHGGRVFNTAGDGFMLEFGSSLAAVEAAGELAATCEPKVRVGVHLGDVVVQPNGDLLGHGVNVAARLMARSEPGGALVSATVRQTIRGPFAERLVSRGVLQLDKMAETIEAFAIGGAGSGGASAPAAAAKGAETLLAVLPFDNLSDDKEMQFFSDGVSEEIIQRLARGSTLKVIGRTTSFQFRGERKGEAARTLKCSHVLDGSVRRAGTRVRVAAHLVEAGSHVTLWSDRFDRSLEDTFAVQDEISEGIAAALHQTFKRAAAKAVDPAAYDLYLRATPHSFAPDELRSNIALLEQAVQRAPQFAEAWGRLAQLRAFLSKYEPYASRAAMHQRIKEEVRHALSADPQSMDAWVATCLAGPPFGRFAELYAALERLWQLPDSVGARLWTPSFCRPLGFVRQSLEDAERAFALDPLSTMAGNLLSLARMAAGKFDGVVAMYEDLVRRSPDMHYAVANLMRAYAFQGNWDGFDRLLDPSAKRPLRELEDGVLFLKTKRDPSVENVDQMRQRLLSRFEQTGGVEVSNLVYAAHVGLGDDVFRLAETARLGPRGASDDVLGVDAYRTGLLFWKDMPEIRNDPRFVRLCARLGLVEFWLSSGKWPDCADTTPYDFRSACETARGIKPEAFGY